jgi:microcystin-dependent protein
MAQPIPYDREFSFTNFQTANPLATLPADQLDAELNSVKQTLDTVLANLELIQRDDGAIANLSVGAEQLAAEVQVGISTPRVWATATQYKISPIDTVFQGSAFYRAKADHTSGVFATDLAAGKWELIVNLASVPLVNASQIAVSPTGGISAVTVQAALAEVDAEKAPLSHTHVATQISDSTAIGRALLTAADAAAAGALLPGLPPGIVFPYAGTSAPAGYLLCGGQAVSRATFAALFLVIGTTYGSGDGATTFNVPDLRGRVVAGKDDMVQGSANRLTNQAGGLDGDILAAVGGSEGATITQAQLPSCTFANSGISVGETPHRHFEFSTDQNVNTTLTNANRPQVAGFFGGDGATNNAAGTADCTIGLSSAATAGVTITAQGSAASGGSGAAHNNVQPTIILNYIIKT